MTLGREWVGLVARQWQTEALERVESALAGGKSSVLVHACTGAGKSVLIAELAARTGGSVLVTTPTQALVDQLAETIEARCPGEVGRAFQHAWEADRRIVVTCLPSLPALLDERPEWERWVADEAHRMEADTLRSIRERLVRRTAVGLTATPYRSDDRGLEAWDELVYSYPSTRARDESVLVPWRVVRWEGDGPPDVEALVERWVSEASGPGIVSATSIDDAEACAARLGVLAIYGALPRAEQRRRMEALRTGEVKALVHVQLLTEGVDMPWLRWIALRRPVGTPVRLVQEVGRTLRSFPGKAEAVIYDPYDAMGSIGLIHDATLEDAQRPPPEPAAPRIAELEGLEAAGLPEPVAVDRVSGWVCDLLANMRGAGLVPPPKRELLGGGWRQVAATQAQKDALRVAARALQYLPDVRHRRAALWLATHHTLRAGPALDLMQVLSVLNRDQRLPVAVPEVAL